MKSKIFSSKYVKTTSKGQIWVPGFLLLGFLLAFPVAELLMLGNWFGLNYKVAQIEYLYENLWRDGFIITGAVVAAGAAFLNGVNGFWYLYSSKKVDFYHSLPIKRSQMFWHKTYVGLLYYLIPYAAMEFLAVCIGAMRGFFSLKLMGMALLMLGIHLVFYLMIYFGVVMMLSITGNLLMGALMEIGLFLYGPMLGLFLGIYKSYFFNTYYPVTDQGIENIVGHLSPFYIGYQFMDQYAEKGGLGYFLLMAAVAVIFGVGAYFAYVKRPAESTGKSMVYRWCQILVKFMVVLLCGLGFGIIFYMIPSPEVQIPWWIFGLVLGTVLSHGILEVIFALDFRRFFANRLQLLLAGGMVAFCAFVFNQDLFSYDSFLPSYEKLENINMDLNESTSGIEHTPYLKEETDGNYELDIAWDKDGAALFSDGQVSRGLYENLRQLVKNQEKEKEDSVTNVKVRYALTSGRKVYRDYSLTEKELETLMNSCFEEASLKEQKYAFLSLDPRYLQWCSGVFMDGEYYTLFQNDQEKKQELLKALKADIEEASSDELLEIPCAALLLQYENIPVESKADRLEQKEFYSCNFFVYPSFQRTVAILRETGYPMSMDEVKIAKFEAMRYGENGEEGNRISYTDKEQIDAIKKVVLPSGLLPSWIPTESGISISFYNEQSFGNGGTYVYALKDQLPEFVKNDLEK